MDKEALKKTLVELVGEPKPEPTIKVKTLGMATLYVVGALMIVVLLGVMAMVSIDVSVDKKVRVVRPEPGYICFIRGSMGDPSCLEER